LYEKISYLRTQKGKKGGKASREAAMEYYNVERAVVEKRITLNLDVVEGRVREKDWGIVERKLRRRKTGRG